MSTRRKVLLFASPSLAVLSMPATLLTLWIGFGITWCDTGSEPVGWYRTTSGPIQRGGFATFKLPEEIQRYAIDRGYLKSRRPWPSYLTKRVAALPGDTVEVTQAGVFINGRLWPDSKPLEHDPAGRSMSAYLGTYRIAPGYFLPLSDHPQGWDGRYFGPQPMSNIVGPARRIWKWN
jgi:conjugative transfer signal peptidase TraF